MQKEICSDSYKWQLKNPHYFLILKYIIDMDCVDHKTSTSIGTR